MMPGRTRLIDRIPMPEFMQRDSELARWLQLVWFGSGTIVGIGLLVTGVGLMALGLVIGLNGFGELCGQEICECHGGLMLRNCNDYVTIIAPILMDCPATYQLV